MPNENPWDRYQAQLYDYAKSWGLNDSASSLYTAVMLVLAYYFGIASSVPILSGLRDAAWTREAQARWDAGDRTGLATRPASNSFHLTGDAFDLADPPDWLASLMGQIVLAWGGRWGGKWSTPDPHHYDTGGQDWTGLLQWRQRPSLSA